MSGQYSSSADYRKSRGIASGVHRNERIGMFEVRKNSTNNMWYLKVNDDRLIGTKFPSKEEALAVLHGLFTGMDGKSAGMNAVIAKMVAEGRGIIDSGVLASQSFQMDITVAGGTSISTSNITGDNILSAESTSKGWNPSSTTVNQLRLWFGSYTGNAPSGSGTSTIYPFRSADPGASGGEYMRRFTTVVTVNGGSEVTLAAPSGSTQAEYQNCPTAVGANIWSSGAWQLQFTVTENS